MKKLNCFLLFVLAISYVPFSFTMEVGINEIASVANAVISRISKATSAESKQISSLEEFEAGSVVNTPGEINDLPTGILNLINLLQTVKTAIVEILQVIQEEYHGQDISGPTINIPNAMVQPYLTLLPEIETSFSNIISCFQNLGGIVQDGIIPLLSQTLQANGLMLVPANAINAIKSNVMNIFSELETLASNLKTAAVQTHHFQGSASFKANTVMNLLDGICTEVAKDLNNVVQGVGDINAMFPSQQVTSTQDETNATIIVKNLNQLFADVNSVLKSVHHYLGNARAAINLIKNPIGGLVFNLL